MHTEVNFKTSKKLINIVSFLNGQTLMTTKWKWTIFYLKWWWYEPSLDKYQKKKRVLYKKKETILEKISRNNEQNYEEISI